MSAGFYSLAEILSVAQVHPFYSDTQYPPTREVLAHILQAAQANPKAGRDLESFPLTRKHSLYQQISRLTVDKDARNGYRRETFVSTTGGGSGGAPMVFATDALENRQQRAVMGNLLRNCGLIEPGDWILTLHVSGHLYRALDLMTELSENAGAAVLCAGPEMAHSAVVEAIIQYRANAVAGDVSQLLQLAKYVTTLDAAQKKELALTKLFYTSESMTSSQRGFLISAFGELTICSIIGSAEAGAWGVSSSALTGVPKGDYTDFIVDKRTIHLEIIPLSVTDPDEAAPGKTTGVQHVPPGQPGLLVQTSLQRLRNPLVRYVCGDIASLHPLPPTLLATLPSQHTEHYQVVRIYGRDQRSSFTWYGEYFEFGAIETFMRAEQWDILLWQIILQHATEGAGIVLEVRIFRDPKSRVSQDHLAAKIREFFWVFDFNAELFRLEFLVDTRGFRQSRTGRKVMQFVDLTA
ncbi:hypothetical protein BO94DRAFT_606939 [Aspergillus sclerotioniger CBS 115572]|uniref:AMP-dependent synthetase/ligase domain-containing protein n=1 Tax=Aspergillus sclerotioniger CBS 115572 TaxID=1450535 RepID=A0A317VNP3_9EURO|nr:hypothetical protein BO94DRAFT_606939 [Aspergillus sclerotioniger CBS 115572]PWY74488.1 hypothetical protein BO94DRAFT_606939 [Aspergillus sclerotioniger CBS 115572]